MTPHPNNLTISATGLDLIKSFEGFAPELYLCPAGKPTIGYGHVVRPGESCARIDRTRAEVLLRDDCKIAEIYLNANVRVPLAQNEFDALCSFAYNLGVGALDQSTLLKKLNAGDKSGAAAEFIRWSHIGKVLSPGLIRRRKRERDLFTDLPAFLREQAS